MIEESSEVKLPTKWTNKEAEVESQRKEKNKKEDQRREGVRKKKIKVSEKVESGQTLCFFQRFVAQTVVK